MKRLACLAVDPAGAGVGSFQRDAGLSHRSGGAGGFCGAPPEPAARTTGGTGGAGDNREPAAPIGDRRAPAAASARRRQRDGTTADTATAGRCPAGAIISRTREYATGATDLSPTWLTYKYGGATVQVDTTKAGKGPRRCT